MCLAGKMRSLAFLLVQISLVCYIDALDDIPLRARGGQAWSQRKFGKDGLGTNSESFTWQAPLDHFDEENAATFTQHYFVDDQYFDYSDPEAPVFFQIGGEAPLNSAPAGK